VAKRLYWLVLGFGLGVGVTVRARRTVRRTVHRVLPSTAADRLRALDATLDQRAALIRARRPAGTGGRCATPGR
jgi:sensor histidine kinase regulating citrate/malate metabolism